MHYLSFIAGTYVTKNKLEKAIYEFLQTQNRLIIPAKELEAFTAFISKGIHMLNIQHPRCTSLTTTWTNYEDETRDYSLTIGGCVVCHFRLYKTKN